MTEEEKRRAYRESHENEMKAYKKAYMKAYNEAHKNEIKAYHESHKEEIKAYKLERYCSHIENIENYELAKADDFVNWDIHHRLETHTSDGIRRSVDLSKAELIALGTYYDRPASELIFLKHGDHMSLHNNGKPVSEETRAKMSESLKGHPCSAETRAKMREAWKLRLSKSSAKN